MQPHGHTAMQPRSHAHGVAGGDDKKEGGEGKPKSSWVKVARTHAHTHVRTRTRMRAVTKVDADRSRDRDRRDSGGGRDRCA